MEKENNLIGGRAFGRVSDIQKVIDKLTREGYEVARVTKNGKSILIKR